MAELLERAKARLMGLNPFKKKKTMDEIRAELSPEYHKYKEGEIPYRIVCAIWMCLVVLGGGVFSWSSTMITYRAPLEQMPIHDLSIPITIYMIPSNDQLVPVANNLSQWILSDLHSTPTLEPLSLEWDVRVGGVAHVSEISVPSGQFAVVLVSPKDWTFFSSTKVHFTEGNAVVVQVDDYEKVRVRVVEAVSGVLVDLPHLESIIRRDRRESLQPWQIAALPPSQQKRLVWDSAALSLEYQLQVIHVHHDSFTDVRSPLPVLDKLAKKLGNVTKLTVNSEHLWDVDMNNFLLKDVQDRLVLDSASTQLLIKEIDSQVESTTESTFPIIKLVVIESKQKVFVLDAQDEDARGAVVADWGGIVSRNEKTDAHLVGVMRVLLGLDADLPVGWYRSPAALSDWELTRLSLRVRVDHFVRTRHSVAALHSLVSSVDNIVIPDSVCARVGESIRLASSSAESDLSSARRLADSALFDPSLLSLLYFPSEHKMGIYLPLFCLYFIPVLLLVPRILLYLWKSFL